jgi:hypothetical protein
MPLPIGEIELALYSVRYMGHWYRGDALTLEYELCSPLPVRNGETVGIEFVDECARLALEFMRATIAEAKRDAKASSDVGRVIGAMPHPPGRSDPPSSP